MGLRVGVTVFLVLVVYPLASRYLLSHGWAAGQLSFVLPVVVYCALFAVFAGTLRPGRTPMISRFARMEQGELNEELSAYTRRLTAVWSAFFLGMAALAAGLAAWAPLQVWYVHTFFVSYALIAALFLGEYLYRRWRYPNYRHAPPWELLRNVIKQGLR